MDSRLRSCLNELIGTFLLVYVSAGTVCAFHLPSVWRLALARRAAVPYIENLKVAAFIVGTVFVKEGLNTDIGS